MHREIARRCMALLLSICMIAGMVDLSGFTVRAAENQFGVPSIKAGESFTFKGEKIEVKADQVVVIDRMGTVIPEQENGVTNYRVENTGENIHAGQDAGTFRVIGEGPYEGSEREGHFTIQKKSLSGGDITLTAEDTQKAAGMGAAPTTVTVTDTTRNQTLNGVAAGADTTGADYTISYSDDYIVGADDTGTKTVTVTITGVNDYEGSNSTTYEIEVLENSGLTIKWKDGKNGEENNSLNAQVGSNGKAGIFYDAIKGDKLNLLNTDFKVEYKGKPVTDFRLEYNTSKGAVSEAEVTAVGTGPVYSGIRTEVPAKYSIVKYIDDDPTTGGERWDVKIKKQKYNGSPIEPEPEDVTITDWDGQPVTVDAKEWQYQANSFRNNTQPGTATVVIEATPGSAGKDPRYTGQMTASFEIEASILDADMTNIKELDCTYDGTTDWYEYIKDNLVLKEGDKVYDQGDDYIIETTGTAVNAGSYTFKLKLGSDSELVYPEGKTEVPVTFQVKKLSVADTSKVTSQFPIIGTDDYYAGNGYNYTGSRIEPKLIMKYQKKVAGETRYEFVEMGQSDYSLSYRGSKDNTNVISGGQVIITGSGTNFEGTRTVDFNILPKEISGGTLEKVNNASSTYTGRPITPDPVFKVDGKQLTSNDYAITYDGGDNTNVRRDVSGDVQYITFFMEGKGNYKGKVTVADQFKISPADIDIVSSGYDKQLIYTGKEIHPENLRITHNGTHENLVENKDFMVAWPAESTVIGMKQFTITGMGNYTNIKTLSYEIVQCDIGKDLSNAREIFDIYTQAGDNGSGVDYHYLDGSSKTTEREFAYKKRGERILPKFYVKIYEETKEEGTKEAPKDFWVEYGNNDELGVGTATIRGQGNYCGEVTVDFMIKGNLQDNLAEFKISDIPYNASIVTPAEEDMELAAFDGKPLFYDKDYTVENSSKDVSKVGQNQAIITGKGDRCFGTRTEYFNVRKFDLSQDYTKDCGYVISGIKDPEKGEAYVYSRLDILPKPTIEHNDIGRLSEGTDYKLEYYKRSKAGATLEKIDAPREVGLYQVKIIGMGDNYTGATFVDFDIVEYDIGENYDKENPDTGIAVSGYEDSVVLDALKEADSAEGAHWDSEKGEVTWKNLAVQHTPEDLEGTNQTAQTMGPEDYEVRYIYDDETIGIAEIEIKGKGNYKGSFKIPFLIQGDLANAEIKEIEPIPYVPPKTEGGVTTPANCAEPEVVYTVEYGTGEEHTVKEITLQKDIDYILEYENNANATKANAEDTERLPGRGPATVKVIHKGADSSVPGSGKYVSENSAEFDILQRDLTYAIGEEGVKDPQLDVAKLEEQYEYTGEDIVPDIEITCDDREVIKKAGDDAGADFDYEVSVINNLNVYTWGHPNDLPHVIEDRVMPKITVTAKRAEDGSFTGNYKGSFEKEFEITPRSLNNADNTIDTPDFPIENVNYEDLGDRFDRDYTGDPITFPIDEDHPVVVTWCKTMDDGSLVYKELVEGQDYVIDHEDNVKIGDGKFIIRAVEYSNYAGEFSKTFKIVATIEAVNPSHEAYGKYISLNYDDNVPYGVKEVFPTLIFTDFSGGAGEEPKILEEGEDFEIIRADSTEEHPTYGKSKNNINVHTYDTSDPYGETEQPDSPTIVVRGIGHYKGTIRRYYNITPKKLTDEDIRVEFQNKLQYEGYENAYEYTGNNIEPLIKVYNGDIEMTAGTDYTITGYDHNKDLSTDSQKAGVTIASVEGGNYTESRRFEFSIVPTPIARATITIENASQIYYDRQAKKPAVKVIYGRDTLVEGNDYTVDYGNYVDAADQTHADETKRPVVKVTGMGGYGGTVTVPYTIKPEDINNQEDIEVTGRAIMREGGPDIAFTIRAKDGTELVEGTDYTVDAYTGTAGIGETGTVTIRGTGNYGGSRQAEFRILPPDGTIQIEKIPSEVYDTKPHTPEVKVSLLVDESRFTVNLVEGIDYNVSYDNNLNAGTAQVKVNGLDYFAGKTAVANFEITKKGIGTGLELADSMVFEPIGNQTYTGRGVTPQVKLTYQNAAEEINSQLVVGRDYVISYANNVAVGTATATITGIGNYSGSYRTTFNIYGNMNMATVAEIPTQEYTGSPVTPVPVISLGGNKLTEGTDYTLEYKNNTERGTATIVITGMGQYTGTKTITFTIARELSDETSIRGVAASYTYTGSAITPPVRVEDNGVLLTKGRDYQVSYKDNVNAGTATITVTGIDKYQGSKSVTFKINPQQLGRATVSKIANQTYNGKTLKPSIKVTSGNVTLQNNKDYTVVYVGGEKPGMASVIIKGTGNFTGTQTVNYNIAVPGLSGVKVSKYSDSGITFSWKKNSVVTGYEVYNSKNRREKMITKNGTTKYTVSKLKAGTSYTFRIRAYVRKSGKYYYGPFTTMKTATAPKSTKISSLASKKSKQVAVKWKKVSGATQYEVYRSTSSKGKYTKIGTTKKTSYTDKKATGGKKYYYKIRVCKTISKKNYYSSYSGAKSIKARK